jgi:general stress protein YciG
MQKKQPRKRGFAAMSPERVKEIASMGGKKAHEVGTAHEFNSKEAQAAGRKGGRGRGSKQR